jgi:hypothetical protein
LRASNDTLFEEKQAHSDGESNHVKGAVTPEKSDVYEGFETKHDH